ncbi:MAG TPA: CehA/McbA family metallohydrolase [Gemmatimonadales bacterium]|jgi:hypothetical protein
MTSRRTFLLRSGLAAGALAWPKLLRAPSSTVPSLLLSGPDLPLVRNVELQPLLAQVHRLVSATDYLGSPLPPSDKQKLVSASQHNDPVQTIQEVLDRHCLIGVTIDQGSAPVATLGPAKPELVQSGWRQFLVKVHNAAGVTTAVRATSDQARPLAGAEIDELAPRWLDLMMFDRQPLAETLSGLALEYRILQLYSRDAGWRAARLAFELVSPEGSPASGTLGAELPVQFHCLPAQSVRWQVRDETGQPTVAAFVIRDAQGRIHPSQAKRLAPDFAFHPQVYRSDGEVLALPAGDYTVEYWHGPESRTKTQALSVADTGPGASAQDAAFQMERWIDPARLGWWSGDHHIHAAGCAHYMEPTEGVRPEDMFRHTLGEDLKVGANLTWGPGFDYQKRFFTGQDDRVSQPTHLLHYDVEVSGFGSDRSGHLVLLRLKEQIPPGGDSDHHWPTLGLNTLRWAKRQGAVCGPAHSGWGLGVDSTDLPNYIVPPFDSIGANEYIMDVTHEVPGPDGTLVPAVDFMSLVDTPYASELNIWYHTLNIGYRTRVGGETDFPCVSGDRVGMGRSYVKLDGALEYADWCEGLRRGRAYVSEGMSHLLEFRVNDVAVGERGSELRLAKGGAVRAKVKAAALLPAQPNRDRGLRPEFFWDLERARIGETRTVPVELIVNGVPVAKQTLVADGVMRSLTFEAPIARSSWVALRILPSSHTNPIWVRVGGRPVRASRRSAEWCLEGVDQCWSQKEQFIAADELDQARADYEHARQTYRRLLAECDVD